MIIYENIVQYNNKDFKEYLSSPGYSYSYLKKEKYGIKVEFKETDKMILGTLVDKILMSPNEADMLSPMYPMAKDIAAKIKSDFPYLIHFEKQICFSAIASYGDFYLPIKGRLDYYLKDSMVIDLKITWSKNINTIIRHFEYNDQVWNYARLGQVKKGYLMIYSVPLKTTTIVEIDVSDLYSNFWGQAIQTFGKVLKKV